MRKISFYSIMFYLFGTSLAYSAEGHSHEIPEFLHFIEILLRVTIFTEGLFLVLYIL